MNFQYIFIQFSLLEYVIFLVLVIISVSVRKLQSLLKEKSWYYFLREHWKTSLKWFTVMIFLKWQGMRGLQKVKEIDNRLLKIRDSKKKAHILQILFKSNSFFQGVRVLPFGCLWYHAPEIRKERDQKERAW